MTKVILIDAMHLAHRMHHSHLDLHTHDWVQTGVIHGVMSNVLWLTDSFPDHCMVFCWDQGNSWRCNVAPGLYKANRGTHPSDARGIIDTQVDILREEMLDVLGIRQVAVESIEGDDIVGILAHGLRNRKDVERVVIYSGDKDFFQLVDEAKVTIIRAGKFAIQKAKERKEPRQFEVVDSQYVADRYGILPKQWTKFRALTGDNSDGLKAVVGIGPKTAALLLGMGVDPSKERVEDGVPKAMRSEKKWVDLVASWNMVHLCYQLSVIPNTPFQIKVPTKIKQELHSITDSIVAKPGRISRPALGKKFMENLTRYELQYCMGRRRQFWQIP